MIEQTLSLAKNTQLFKSNVTILDRNAHTATKDTPAYYTLTVRIGENSAPVHLTVQANDSLHSVLERPHQYAMCCQGRKKNEVAVLTLHGDGNDQPLATRIFNQPFFYIPTVESIKTVYHDAASIKQKMLLPPAGEVPAHRVFTVESSGIEVIKVRVPQTSELEAVLSQPHHTKYYRQGAEPGRSELIALAGTSTPDIATSPVAYLYVFNPPLEHDVLFTHASRGSK